jgi:[citrate (pro-3S)-lyase] ligase
MNANPFTNGHLYLVERAAAENERLHLFLVSDDSSLVPFAVRERLVREGTAHLRQVEIHHTGSYLVSSSCFRPTS